MKKALEIICTAIECFLFLWLVVGLWACANKIREMENWNNERLESIRTFDLPEKKLNALVIALHKIQQDTDVLRIRIEDIEDLMGIDHATGILETDCSTDELMKRIDNIDSRIRKTEAECGCDPAVECD